MLKGKGKLETAENYSIAAVFGGALLLSAGMGLSIFGPKGFSTILAMLGSFITFVATFVLILVWAMKEFKGG
jgi:hypothetical protein